MLKHKYNILKTKRYFQKLLVHDNAVNFNRMDHWIIVLIVLFKCFKLVFILFVYRQCLVKISFLKIKVMRNF